MRFDDVLPSDQSVLHRMLVEALRTWDAESPTLYGLSRDDLSGVVRNWPSSLVDDEYRAALAINNVCADLLGGSNAWSYPADVFLSSFGTSREHVKALFRQIESRLGAAIRAKERA